VAGAPVSREIETEAAAATESHRNRRVWIFGCKEIP
jgi:hypothetical protein